MESQAALCRHAPPSVSASCRVLISVTVVVVSVGAATAVVKEVVADVAIILGVVVGDMNVADAVVVVVVVGKKTKGGPVRSTSRAQIDFSLTEAVTADTELEDVTVKVAIRLPPLAAQYPPSKNCVLLPALNANEPT